MDQKKFPFSESLLMVLITSFADGIEALVSLMGIIPVITPISIGISWLINLFTFGVILFWFIIKGERGLWYTAGSILEFIPFVNILPIRTCTCIIGIFMANHPKISKVANVVTKKLKGKDSDNEKGKSDKNSNDSNTPISSNKTNFKEAA